MLRQRGGIGCWIRNIFLITTALQKTFCVDLDLIFPFLYSLKKLVTLLKQVVFIIFFSLHSFHSQGTLAILGDSEITFFFIIIINEKWPDKEFPEWKKNNKLKPSYWKLCVLSRWAPWPTGQFNLLSTGYRETSLNFSPQWAYSL